MRVLKKIIFTAVSFLIIAGTASLNAAEANYQVIPLPNSIKPAKGTGFSPNSKTTIVYPKGNVKMQKNAENMKKYSIKSCILKIWCYNTVIKSNRRKTS